MARFYTPPGSKGQIVEVSYAGTPRGIVMRVYDRSDRSEYYRLAKWTPKLEDWWDSVGPWNEEPPTRRFGKMLGWKEVSRILNED